MKTHIASAFDKNFLVRGLATYRSIYPHTPDAHFWVLCLDNETKPMMEKMNLKNVSCITLEEMNNKELLETRPKRNNTEFAMTSKSCFLSYLINTNKVKSNEILILTDVDMIFYSPIHEFIEKKKITKIIVYFLHLTNSLKKKKN